MPMRPCRVEIHTRFLEDNYRFLSALAAPHAELLAIVKADAYGHSLSVCAPAVARAGVRWLGVCSVEEGVAARVLENLGLKLETVREAVRIVAGRCVLEVSGGVRLQDVRDIAATGVDIISVGALTTRAPWIDMSLDLE